MGYYANGNGDVCIPAKYAEAAFQKLQRLAETNPDFKEIKDAKDLLSAFDLIGFEDSSLDLKTGFCLGFWNSKYRSEYIAPALEAVAEFVVPDSIYRWRGDGDEYWAWTFDGKEMKEIGGDVVYSDGSDISLTKAELPTLLTAIQEYLAKHKGVAASAPAIATLKSVQRRLKEALA